MKHQTLRIAAYCLGVLAWVVAIVGVVVSITIGIGAATIIARVAFLLGGLVLTAIYALILLTVSKLIHLFIGIKDNLEEIVTLAEKGSAKE